jgi:hypothetical protein
MSPTHNPTLVIGFDCTSLLTEHQGIYAGLVMVESKCIEVDNAQSSNSDANHRLNNEQWQALIALHRTLLHEHHGKQTHISWFLQPSTVVPRYRVEWMLTCTLQTSFSLVNILQLARLCED